MLDARAPRPRKRRLRAREEKRQKKEALARLPRHFDVAALGQGKKGGGGVAFVKARQQLLERLRLRAPPLPADVEEWWPAFVARYAEHVGVAHKEKVGTELLARIRRVKDGLGGQLRSGDGKPRAPSGSVAKGNPDVFEAWVRAK